MTSKSKHRSNKGFVRVKKFVTLTEPMTHLPKSIPLIVGSSTISTGMDFSAEKIYTVFEPADTLIQRLGRCSRVTNW